MSSKDDKEINNEFIINNFGDDPKIDIDTKSTQINISIGSMLGSIKKWFSKSKGKKYDTVFISYSRKDIEIVKGLEKVFHAVGYDVHIDESSLRTGDVWWQRLKELIDEADLFLLCWSENAAKSEYVREEWEYAISLDREGFIRPIYWDEPMPPVPDKLKHIHFKHVNKDEPSLK